MNERLVEEAYGLIRALNNKIYWYLFYRYARLPYYDHRSETDPYAARIDRILGRAYRRAYRRMARARVA